MVRRHENLREGRGAFQVCFEPRQALIEERLVAAVELDEFAVVPASDDVERARGKIGGIFQQVCPTGFRSGCRS